MIEEANSADRPTVANSPAQWWMWNPTRTATTISTAVANSMRASSTAIFANSTDPRPIGSVRNRSMTPLLKSWLKPVPTPCDRVMLIIAIMPGMTYCT